MEEEKAVIKDRKRTRRAILYSRIKRKILSRHVWVVRLGILAGILGGVVFLLLIIWILLKVSGLGRYVSLGRAFVFASSKRVETHDGRSNILILGKAGEGKIAPDLTDTIILASVSYGEESEMVMVSLPRDIWIDELRAKLNSAYYWGNEKRLGGGMILAKSSVEEIVGVPVHYAIVVDFSGFVELIDTLGGIEVEVERGFIDEWFPIAGRENDECDGDPEYKCRYETVEFEKGLTMMDGEKALKFVRSRHSEDLEEGTDVARAARQQKVLAAVKAKIMSEEILLSPKKLREVWRVGNSMIETDLKEEEMAVLARWIYDLRDRIESWAIPEEFLVNPPLSLKYDNLYVFVPRGDDWSEVHEWVESVMP